MGREIRLIHAGSNGSGEACRCALSLCVRLPVVPDPGEGRRLAMALLTAEEVAEVEDGFLNGPTPLREAAPAGCPFRAPVVDLDALKREALVAYVGGVPAELTG